MIYINYNSTTGAILNAYHSSCLPDIPEPTVQTTDEIWADAVNNNKERYVDITKTPPELVIGDPQPEPTAATRYSKLKIIRKAKETTATNASNEEQTLWTALKAFIQSAGAEDEWLAAAWLASDDTMFSTLCAALAQQFPGFDVEAFLADCLY